MTSYGWVGVGFTLWCLWLLKNACVRYAAAKASQHWPSTEGQMTAVQLWGKRNIQGTMQDTERLAIQYRYEVMGRQYESREIAFFTILYPQTVQFAQNYPVGSQVPVWFNPKNPDESVVVPGLNPVKPHSDLILAGLGVIVGVGVSVGLFTEVIG